MKENNISITEQINYINKNFFCEKLHKKHEELINSFENNIHETSLEAYLKNDSYSDIKSNEVIVYLIKHKKEDLLSHYFSLRCGLVCKLKPYEKLSEEELNILTAY